MNKNTKKKFEIWHSQHRQQSSINTPVVALQTPGITGLPYPALSSFGAQDFSINSSDVMSLSNWNHQNLGNLQHTKWVRQLLLFFVSECSCSHE